MKNKTEKENWFTKWVKRIIGSKRNLTWLIDEILIVVLFFSMYKNPIVYKLALFGILKLSSLIVLGLIEFEDIKLEYKK